MALVRYFVSAAMSLVITCLVFLLMRNLIAAGERDFTQLDVIAGMRFRPVEIPVEVNRSRRQQPQKPPRTHTLPTSPGMPLVKTDEPVDSMVGIDMPDFEAPLIRGMGQGLLSGDFRQAEGSAEGAIVPVIVIRPLYPRAAAVAGIEGWVQVEFTITPAGTVEDAKVINGEPPRVFNREAIRAILKWKFKPRVVNGVAVARRATQIIDFSLNKREAAAQ